MNIQKSNKSDFLYFFIAIAMAAGVAILIGFPDPDIGLFAALVCRACFGRWCSVTVGPSGNRRSFFILAFLLSRKPLYFSSLFFQYFFKF